MTSSSANMIIPSGEKDEKDEPKTTHNNKQFHAITIEDAVDSIGSGRFQYLLLLAAGLCFMADAMEILLLSFLGTILRHEWNLSEHQINLLVSIVFLGALIGTLVLGTLADRVGRRPVFIGTTGLLSIAGVGTAFCTNYWQLLIMRFLVGFGVGGLIVPFDTLGEFLPKDSRGKQLLGIEFFWTIGTLSVPLLAYWTLNTDYYSEESSHWQRFVIYCSLPCFASMILGIWWLPESPRWLLEQQENDQALAILKRMAHTNGKTREQIEQQLFPTNTRLVVSLHDVDKQEEPNNNNESNGIQALFRTPHLRQTTLVLWATWFGFGFLYYGVILAVNRVFTIREATIYDDDYYDDQQQSVDASYAFDYGAIFISATSEVVGLLLVFGAIDSVGRIPSQTFFYRVGGVATLALGIVVGIRDEDLDMHSITIVFAFVARMAMMAASCTTWVSTTEILSTDVRGMGHGAANAMARLGGMVAPFVMTESNSMVTIGIVAFVVALGTAQCAELLPETAGKPLGVSANDENDGDRLELQSFKHHLSDTADSTTPYRELVHGELL